MLSKFWVVYIYGNDSHNGHATGIVLINIHYFYLKDLSDYLEFVNVLWRVMLQLH